MIEIEGDNKSPKIDKNKVSEILEEPNILEMPDNSSDNIIGISDIPIMKISNEEKVAKKPMGSAYIHTKMSIGRSSKQAEVYICRGTHFKDKEGFEANWMQCEAF